MYIQKVVLNNFRNYNSREYVFTEGENVILGKNGVGKTNILEALYLFFKGKSFRKASMKDMLHLGEESFSINLMYYTHFFDSKTILFDSGKGIILKSYDKIKSGKDFFFQIIPLLMSREVFNLAYFTNADLRHFFDALIVIFDSEYYIETLKYKKILEERNACFKSQFYNSSREVWDELFIQFAEIIVLKRRMFIEQINPFFKKFILEILPEITTAQIEFISNYTEKTFRDFERRDIEKGYTHIGPHKDNYLFTIDGRTMSKYASQGQMKSIIIALSLASLCLLHKNKINNVYVLLDDIFEELDSYRCTMIKSMLDDFPFQKFYSAIDNGKNLFKNAQFINLEL